MNKYLTDLQREVLETALKQQDLSKEYQNRLKIMLLADEGRKQVDICNELKCSQATARYWILVLQEGKALTWNQTKRGRPIKVSATYREILRDVLSQSPRRLGYPFRYWTADKLVAHMQKETGISICKRQMYRLLEEEGLSTRPKQINRFTLQSTHIVFSDL
jgi:transposase